MRCSARKPASPRSIFVASLHAATVYRSKNESFLLPVQRPRRVVGSPLFVFPFATVYGTRECFCPCCTLLGTPDSLMPSNHATKFVISRNFVQANRKTLPLLNTDNTGKTEVVCNS